MGSCDAPIAFSSEVDTGSREENASKQNPEALLLTPSKAKTLLAAPGSRSPRPAPDHARGPPAGRIWLQQIVISDEY